MFTSSINLEGLEGIIGGKDPVCGKELQPTTAAATASRDAKTFYFCSTDCKNKFEAEPEKYCGCC